VSFLILSLPRSRSSWLAHFLAPPPLKVGHDILVQCPDFRTFKSSYEHGMTGSVETGGAPIWKLVRKEMPDCKIVLVRRPLIEVYRSAIRAGAAPVLSDLAEASEQLNAAAMDEEVSSIDYSQLNESWACARLFEYCLGFEPSFKWVLQFMAVNIQANMQEHLDRINPAVREALLEDVRRLENCLLN
jgi:hypothetical protein